MSDDDVPLVRRRRASPAASAPAADVDAGYYVGDSEPPPARTATYSVRSAGNKIARFPPLFARFPPH